MRRRDLVVGSISCGLAALASRAAEGYEKCVPHMAFGQLCEAGISIGNIAYAPQNMSQWCWAASVHMAFKYYGYSVSQARIVRETYGIIGNIPAVTGYAISKNLQRDWVDDAGQEFSVTIDGLYDYDAGIMGLSNRDIVDALSEERPLILGTVSHAVLLVSVAYVPTPVPMIKNYGVADPWPNIGLRGPQSAADLYPMHLGGRIRYICLPNID